MVNDGRRVEQFIKACAEAPFAGTVVKDLAKIVLFHDLRNQRRKLHGSDTLVRIGVQILLLGTVGF